MAITINQRTPVSEADLLDLSRRNPGYQFERRSDGGLIVTPTGSKSGLRSAEVLRQLAEWSRSRAAGPAFDSSTGFRLPDGSVLSPDAAWVSLERWSALSSEDQEDFAPLCPDAVFEVRSKSSPTAELREKMRAYLDNGARLAVLIDPYDRFVEIRRPNREPEHRTGDRVSLDPELADFVLGVPAIYE